MVETALIHAATSKPVDSGNPLPVTLAAGEVGAIYTDGGAFTASTSELMLSGAIRDDTSPSSVTEGKAGALRMNRRRSLHTVIRDGAENQRGANVTPSNELAVAIGIAESTVMSSVTDGKVVAIQTDPYKRPVIYGADKSQGAIGIVDEDPVCLKSYYEQLLDITLNNSTTTDGSTAFFVGDKDKVSFLVKSDWASSTVPTATYTVDCGPTSSGPWIPCDLLLTDDGCDALQNSVIHDGSVDPQQEAFSFPICFTSQYIKGRVSATDTNVTDTIASDLYCCWKKG